MDYECLRGSCLTQHEIYSLPDLEDFLQETISIKIFPVQKQTLDMSFLWFWDTYESTLVTNLSWQRNHPAASGALIYLLSSFISFLAVSFTCVCPQEAETQAGVLGISWFPQQEPCGQQRLRNASQQCSVADLGGSQHERNLHPIFHGQARTPRHFEGFMSSSHWLAPWIQTSGGLLKFPPVKCTLFVT